MVLLGDSDINLKGLRSKKKKMVDNSDWRPWSELPEVLLYLITKWLGTIDHLMFGCVCEHRGCMLCHTGKSLWHPNLHLLFLCQTVPGELVTSITSLMEGC